MQIRRLELFGFKSFVARTRLDFDEGITAIVGPNGCGKSNILDAVRWVLGEQSPSHLRGKAMEDVIFNGNERTGPLGMAEVSMVLERAGSGPLWGQPPEADTEESDLRRQLSAVSEITVTRRYYRSGESEYQINRVPCRLRDITELFLGSGLGTKAYAIIEQGRVDQLVNAKPDALRLFIEEAAGTTLYRSRRVVAERKLERTREHLTRLSDVIHEIERQTNTLTRQAKRAEEYRRYRDELKDLELRAAYRRHRALAGEIEAGNERLAPLATQEEQQVSELRGAEQAAADAHAAVRKADEDQRQSEVRIVQLRLEAQAVEQRQSHIDETLADLDRQRHDAASERGRLESDLTRTADDVRAAERTLAELRTSAVDATGQRESLEAEVHRLAGAVDDADRSIEDAKTEAVQALAEELRIQNVVSSHGHRRQELQRRAHDTGESRRGLAEAASRGREELEQARRRVTELRAEAERVDATRIGQSEAVDAARTSEAAAAREAEEARDRVASMTSRLRSLEELCARWEGCSRGVRHVVENARDATLGVVADVLQVAKPYEPAVAAALGSRLQCLIVRDHSQSVRALRTLEGGSGGRASFIPLSPRGPVERVDGNGDGRTLLDVVETPHEYRELARSLLGNVVLVDSVADAVALWQRNGKPIVAVTKNGDLIDALGVLTGGTDHPIEETLLARNREVRELQAALSTAEAAAAAVAERHRAAAERVETLRRAADEVIARLQELHIESARALKDQERLEQDQDRLAGEDERAASAQRTLECEDAELEAELARFTAQLREAVARRGQQDALLDERRRALDVAKGEAEAARRRLTDLTIEAAHRDEQLERAEDLGRRATEHAAETRTRLDALGRRTVAIDETADRLRTERQELQQQREGMLAGLVTSESEAAAAVDRAAAAAAEAGTCEARVRQRRESLEECREERRRIDVDLAERRATLEHLITSVREKYDEDLASIDAARISADELEDEETASERIDHLRAKLSRLGDVHVGAIDELEDLRSRQEYLTRQMEDLQRSVDDLRRTIAKLNRLSRTRFRETFELANAKLAEVFPRLFPGGKAQLVLTETEEGEEPGVEIIVQPVGKKLGSLNLLSGGEKAMTAVALILSLFLIKPTPFCVLDEVDAPLDDANVGRYDQLVREISRHSQFVLITHNKRTMEAADTLYGITMEEPGVSKVVSVRLKHAA